jgi:hypothetical protein
MLNTVVLLYKYQYYAQSDIYYTVYLNFARVLQPIATTAVVAKLWHKTQNCS